MYTIHVHPVKRWFTRRQQWTFTILGGNGEGIDPRDTYFNVGDIRGFLYGLLRDEPVTLVVHYESGDQVEVIR